MSIDRKLVVRTGGGGSSCSSGRGKRVTNAIAERGNEGMDIVRELVDCIKRND